MEYTPVVRKLFEWNAKNLVHQAPLKKAEIGDYFADQFLVIANGKRYEANHDNYFEFLNEFRSTISKISYEFDAMIADGPRVAIPLKAHIVRIDALVENFEAILILTFNPHGKIILWHEVYVKI
jgi:hypothetical protein